MDFLLSSPKEVAIVGKDADSFNGGPGDIKPLLDEAWRKYLPNKVVAHASIDDAEAIAASPLLQKPPTARRPGDGLRVRKLHLPAASEILWQL